MRLAADERSTTYSAGREGSIRFDASALNARYPVAGMCGVPEDMVDLTSNGNLTAGIFDLSRPIPGIAPTANTAGNWRSPPYYSGS